MYTLTGLFVSDPLSAYDLCLVVIQLAVDLDCYLFKVIYMQLSCSMKLNLVFLENLLNPHNDLIRLVNKIRLFRKKIILLCTFGVHFF